MSQIQTAPLYVKLPDALPGDFSKGNLTLRFSAPIRTSFTYGLVEEIKFLPESIGKYVLSYTIGDQIYFVSLLNNKACLTEAGGNGALHEAFLLMEEADTAVALPLSTPKPHPNTSAYTVYKVLEEQGRLYFHAILKNKYLDKMS